MPVFEIPTEITLLNLSNELTDHQSLCIYWEEAIKCDMSLDCTVCVTWRTGNAHQLIPLWTKSQGGCKAGLQACLLQTKISCIKPGKSVSCCDNGNKTVEFTHRASRLHSTLNSKYTQYSKVTMIIVKELLFPKWQSHCKMITFCLEFTPLTPLCIFIAIITHSWMCITPKTTLRTAQTWARWSRHYTSVHCIEMTYCVK